MPPTYEITIENAASPHLPPPLVFKEPAKAPPGAAAPAPPSPDDLDDEPSSRSPADDLLLNETVRILQDYVGLLGRRPTGA